METQFRYAATWQYRYRLGDSLIWGRNDVGDEKRDAAVLGVVDGSCPKCDFDDDWKMVVIVRSNILSTVTQLRGQFDFSRESFFYLPDGDARTNDQPVMDELGDLGAELVAACQLCHPDGKHIVMASLNVEMRERDGWEHWQCGLITLSELVRRILARVHTDLTHERISTGGSENFALAAVRLHELLESEELRGNGIVDTLDWESGE